MLTSTPMSEKKTDLAKISQISGLLKHSSGRFARPGDNLDGAENDADAVRSWLKKHEKSPNTYRVYERHLKALLTWLGEQSLELTDLTRPQAADFLAWAADPPEKFIGKGKLFAAVLDGGKPGKPLLPLRTISTPASRNQRVQALNSLFTHMIQSGYVERNPFAGVRSEGDTTDLTRRFRSLDHDTFQLVLDEIDSLEAVERARMRLVIIGMTKLAARRFEASKACLCDLVYDPPKKQWWWMVMGKGGKPAQVPVHPDVINVLQDYRAARGLPLSWNTKDTSPIFPGMSGVHVTDNMHYRNIKALFSKAALRADGTSGARLSSATPHWLRHTGLSRLVEIMPIHEVKEIARHSSVNTTATYTTADEDKLYEGNKRASL